MPPTPEPVARTSAPLIEIADLTVRLDGQPVLRDVDLTVEPGEFVGIVGPNGSGKTTLLRAILGLQPPTRGTVRLLGEPVAELRDRAGLGYVPQHAAAIEPGFPASALEVALLGRTARRGLLRRFRDEDRAAATAALERVGVAHLADRPVGTLSGGERQRVLLAKALAGEPDVLTLDEPTAGVDPGAREAFYNLVDSLSHREGITVLLVSHDVQAVQLCCHRLVALNQRVVFDGAPGDFQEAGGFSEVYEMEVHHHHHPGGGGR